MATTRTLTAVFATSPQRLLAVLTHPDFLVAQQKLDPGTVDASVKEVTRARDRLVLELQATEYARGLLGIDRHRTQRSVTTYTWDLANRRCEWTYRAPFSQRFDAAGSDRIDPEGDGARLTTEFRLDVRVPLIGRKIEKLVIRLFDERQPKYERVVRQFCARLP